MINQRPSVNGVLAAVLSASFLPIHGALAKEEKPAKPRAATKHAPKNDAPKNDAPKNGAGKQAKPAAHEQDAVKEDDAGAPAGVDERR